VFEFIRAFFNPSPPSGATAKERLRLVLLSDHLSLAPEVVEAMKHDLLEVLSRYVEIDMAHADVTFEQRDAEVAMLASVPITGLRDRKRASAPLPMPPLPAPQPVEVSAAAVDPEMPSEPQVEQPQAAAPAEPAAETAPAARVPDARPRRRRRKKAANQNGQQGQTKLSPPGIAASQA